MKEIKLLVVLWVFVSTTSVVHAREITVSLGADIVSSYIWRGLYCGPASVQSSISLSVGNFSIGTWGSASFENTWREVDLYAGYTVGNFSVLVTDYFFPHDLPAGERVNYFDYSEHVFEATLGYSFGEFLPLSLAWNTNFAGDDDYSSYVEACCSLQAGSVAIDLVVGATPWAGLYSGGFALVNTSIKASKEMTITDSFSLPVFSQIILNPDRKDVFLVFGVSF